MDQTSATEPANYPAVHLSRCIAQIGKALAVLGERLDGLIQQADDDDRLAVWKMLMEASCKLDEARHKVETSLDLFR